MKRQKGKCTLLLAELEGLGAVGQEGGARVGDNLSKEVEGGANRGNERNVESIHQSADVSLFLTFFLLDGIEGVPWGFCGQG